MSRLVERTQSAPPVIGSLSVNSVSVADSANVHVGNKTFYQGPVTVVVKPTESPTARTKNASGLWESLWFGVKSCPWIVATVAIICGALLITSIVFVVIYCQKKDDTDKDVVIYDRNEWNAQPPEPNRPLFKLTPPVENIIITHSGGENCSTHTSCCARVRQIQMVDIERRVLADITHNFLVGGDGSAFEGRGWDIVGEYSQPEWNNKSVDICFLGNFSAVEPTPKQLREARRLIKYGVRIGKIMPKYRLIAHNQTIETDSPGSQLYEEIKHWENFDPMLKP